MIFFCQNIKNVKICFLKPFCVLFFLNSSIKMAASERSEIGRRVDPSMASANQEAVFRCWAGKVSSYLDAKDMAMWTSASKLLYGARATVRVFEGVQCRQNVDSLILFVNTLVGLRVLDLEGLEIFENVYISQIKISCFGFVL